MILLTIIKNIQKCFYIQAILFVIFISFLIYSCSKQKPEPIIKYTTLKDTTFIDCHCVMENRSEMKIDSEICNNIGSIKYLRIEFRKKIISKHTEELSNNNIIVDILLSLYELIDTGNVSYGKNIKSIDDSIKKLVNIDFCEERISNGVYILRVLYPGGIINIKSEDLFFDLWLKNVIVSCRKKYILTENGKEYYKLELFRDTLETVLMKYDSIAKSISKNDYFRNIIKDICSNNFFKQSHYQLTDGMKYLIDNIIITNILEKNIDSLDIICKGYADETSVHNILYKGDTVFYPSVYNCEINRILRFGEIYNSSNYNLLINNTYIKGESGNCILSYIRAFNTVKYIKEKLDNKNAKTNYYYSGGGVLSSSELLSKNRKFEVILKNK